MRRSRPAVSRRSSLVSDRIAPTQHLRVLAELAGRVEQEAFMDRWLAAKDEQRLRELLLREDQHGGAARRPGALGRSSHPGP